MYSKIYLFSEIISSFCVNSEFLVFFCVYFTSYNTHSDAFSLHIGSEGKQILLYNSQDYFLNSFQYLLVTINPDVFFLIFMHLILFLIYFTSDYNIKPDIYFSLHISLHLIPFFLYCLLFIILLLFPSCSPTLEDLPNPLDPRHYKGTPASQPLTA